MGTIFNLPYFLLFFQLMGFENKGFNPHFDHIKINRNSDNELNDSLILVKIFGKIDGRYEPCERMNGQFFTRAPYDSAQFSKGFEAIGSYDCFVERVENIQENGVDKKLVVLSGVGFTCHVCAGLVSMAIFSKKEGIWSLESYEKEAAVIGQTGYPVDEIQIEPAGKETYAIILKRGGIWFGYDEHYCQIVIYQNGIFKEALKEHITYSSDNWSNAEYDPLLSKAYGFTSSFEFVWGGSEIANMIIHFQGTVLNKKGTKAVLLDKKVLFTYKNGFYSTTEKLPGPN